MILIFQFVKLSVLQNIFHLGNNSDSSYGTESSGLLLKIIGPLFARLSKKIPPIGAMLATDVSLTNTSGQFFNESGKVVPPSCPIFSTNG